MKKLQRAIEVIRLIRQLGHESVLVGGLAVSTWTRERFTKDMDFAVAVTTDEESEQLAISMQHQGYRLTTVIEQEAHRIIATLRFRDLQDHSSEPSIDLLCGSCGIENEIVRDASVIRIAHSLELPVARLPHLLAMKILSEDEVRIQDQADIKALIQVASEGELRETRRLLQLISDRAFHRGKKLQQVFEKFIAISNY
ncbi:nucleotidyl transferase AbiEii/AbiGii toxin family protein [bacterium]|nr:nucleotidyl transferase AbiEii/AbiGii toxin family protein [bacterium]